MSRTRAVDPKKSFFTEQDIEAMGIMSAQALRNQRTQGKSVLPYVKFGRAVRYPKKAVAEFVLKHTVQAMKDGED